MTIEEAIDYNTALVKDLRARRMPGSAGALQLGIEALRRVAHQREHFGQPWADTLPGETP